MLHSQEAPIALEVGAKEQGGYLYCVANAGEGASLGGIGIEGHEVRAIPYKDLSAVLHHCRAQAYRSENQEVVTAWVVAHHGVVNAAWKRWDTVLPLTFNTIVQGETQGDVEANVASWLKEEYERLRSQMERVRDRAEYGVQVLWDLGRVAQSLAEASPEIEALYGQIKAGPRGLAYLCQQRLENIIRRQTEAKAGECFKELYSRIRKHADAVRVETARKAEPGWQMALNLSCLVHRDRCHGLKEELDTLDHAEGFRVRFTGPWPPYSFVGGIG